jgi:putative membrane protein
VRVGGASASPLPWGIIVGVTEDDGAEREPDYRMTLASERTYLAQVRTALALLAGGVAVVGALPDAGAEDLRRVIGVILVVLGLLLATTAYRRWRAIDRAMRRGEPLPRNHTAVPLALGLAVAGALALVAVFLV